MRIAADTNVIVRALVDDDAIQSPAAVQALSEATLVAFPIVALAEAVWVLRSVYRWSGPIIATALRTLLDDPRVAAEWPLVEAGLSLLARGGDFADGVIAADGRRLGADRLATFDRQAAALLEAAGEPVILPG